MHRTYTISIYIAIHLQTVSKLFSVAKHIGRLKLESKPTQIYDRLSIIPLSQQANHVPSGFIRHYIVAFVCLYFCLTGYQSAQFIRRALYFASGSRTFIRQSAQHPWESVYILNSIILIISEINKSNLKIYDTIIVFLLFASFIQNRLLYKQKIQLVRRHFFHVFRVNV